ncbi:MAG TPA: gluconeogenesis factor YvcK family protein [Candidatus Limnocylindrales bacterium]
MTTARESNAALPARERRLALRRWLQPGIGIKRWLLVAFVGEILIALAAALVLRPILAQSRPDNNQLDILSVITLQFLDPDLRALVFFAIGAVLFVYGGWRVLRALVEPYRMTDEPLADLLYQRRSRARGPHIVAIGGGTGLSVLLRGLKEVTSNITAVVTVADDGGSSGKLRTEMGVPPMGDIRMCIAALADAEPAMSSLLQYRFPADNDADPHFAGHAFGNLLIAALTDVNGDFEEAVRQSNRVLAVRGSVVPVAGEPITLHAELDDGSELEGESQIQYARGINHVWITPDDIRPTEEALTAIAAADVVVIGPGSLYTSLMPPLLVPGMREALARTSAARVFVCNVATQLGETEGYGVLRHLEALARHGLGDLVDVVLVNDNTHARQLPDDPASPVELDVGVARRGLPMIMSRDVVDDDNAHKHDARKLTAAIVDLYDERTALRDPATAA